ncbi:MAG: gliding motility-associated C-terminal domain-containing protein [Bacteroidetes bacterium]|nr:gliding motility-associated C-terminal domain-containing protein [Bacteroidota bacterium]
MKNALYILLYYFLSGFNNLYSQNLVPNYSFEQYDTCPNNVSQIYYAVPWFQPNNGGGNTTNSSSTDYYNPCSTNPFVSAPQNVVGYQYARTGVSYAGFSGFNPGGWPPLTEGREYLEVQLVDTLTAGKKYCVSFYVSFGDQAVFAIDMIGAYFSNNSILQSDPNYSNLPFIPQINNSKGNVISDTLNWILITDDFIANGGEQFMTIGNFYLNDSTTIVNFHPTGNAYANYYYIDDVTVTPSVTANAGTDVSIVQGQNTTLNASGGGIYNWYPSTGLNCTTCSTPVTSPNTTTTYYVVVSDSFACGNDTDSVTVFVTPTPVSPETTLFFPNAFSPNGDGQNDMLYVKGSIKEMHLEIYNRWGEKVFESSEQNMGWDGKNAPTAVYVYYLKAIMNDGKEIFQKGNISLIR